VIGLVQECYEKGILTKKDCDGLEMTWAMRKQSKKMLHKIANRDGFGMSWPRGVMRAAAKIGGDAPKFAIHTMKGSAPGAMTTAFPGMSFLTRASRTRGPSRRPGGQPQPDQLGFKPVTNQHDWEQVITQNANLNGRRMVEDSLVVCRQACQLIQADVEALNAATGWDFTLDEAMNLGKRTVNLLRMFNFRCGLTKDKEAPSERYGSAIPDGPSKGFQQRRIGKRSARATTNSWAGIPTQANPPRNSEEAWA